MRIYNLRHDINIKLCYNINYKEKIQKLHNLIGLVYNTTSRERIHNLAFTTFSGRTKR